MARPKNKKLPKAEKIKVIERDKLKCVECDKNINLVINKHNQSTLENGHFHHIIPSVYGGDNLSHNACILCLSCHFLVHSGEEVKDKYFKMYENFVREKKLNIQLKRINHDS